MPRKRLVPFPVVGLAVGLAATGLSWLALPAQAQNDPAPIVQGTTSGEMRVANAQLNTQIIDLQSKIAPLTGRIEQLEFFQNQGRKDITRMQGDDAEIGRLIGDMNRQIQDQAKLIAALTARLDALEGAGGAGGPLALAPAETTLSIASETGEAAQTGPTILAPQAQGAANLDAAIAQQVSAVPQQAPPQGTLGTLPASALPGDAGDLFSEAKSRLLRFDYAGAEAAFSAFLEQFSDDPQAGAAQYWLAETLYQQDEYAASGQAYTKMIRTYPDDRLAPEALAKMARSMRLIGETDKACGALNLLSNRYPNASGVTKNLAASERTRAGCDG